METNFESKNMNFLIYADKWELIHPILKKNIPKKKQLTVYKCFQLRGVPLQLNMNKRIITHMHECFIN